MIWRNKRRPALGAFLDWVLATPACARERGNDVPFFEDRARGLNGVCWLIA
ncbi:MAG: hypothetical protein ACQKBV_09140 [Puniceicoccales bacterium]